MKTRRSYRWRIWRSQIRYQGVGLWLLRRVNRKPWVPR